MVDSHIYQDNKQLIAPIVLEIEGVLEVGCTGYSTMQGATQSTPLANIPTQQDKAPVDLEMAELE